MVISIEKTKAMLITSRHKNYRLTEAQRDLNINLHGNTIISTKHEKLLGILIDNNLTWHPQVKKVRQTIIFKISILRKIRKYLPSLIRILYYNYYIKPNLEYCCSVWGNCSRSDIDTLIKLQKQAARLILETDRYAPSAPLFSELRWQTFDQITRERQAFMVFKATNNKTPSYITNMFQSACINPQHSLRSKQIINYIYQKHTQKVCDTLDPKYGIRWATRSAKLKHVISLEQNTNHFLIMLVSNFHVLSSYLLWFSISISISNYVILNQYLQLCWITCYFRSVPKNVIIECY